MTEVHLVRDQKIWGSLLIAYGFTCYCKGGDLKEGSMVKIWEVATGEVVRNIGVLTPVSDMNTIEVIVISETSPIEVLATSMSTTNFTSPTPDFLKNLGSFRSQMMRESG
ncbi:hypothetical protein J1N35_008139 [Gossypium stocksii]|uniref:Uncharacterized protein n=1 Tax=Gossypium stocksii TaxID=47602 RepID=A0A9D3W8J5_9ROSI|nr:hypothetical protein J1N35_008139 [Gossypium stocksii]